MSEYDGSNLTAKVYTALRNAILDGKLPQGTALTEAAVAKEYSVSRTPVREALRQLEQVRLVTITPNKGAIVDGITKNDIDDIYAVRLKLEGYAAERAAENATDEDIRRMSEIIDLTTFYCEHSDIEQLKSMDGRFHEYIYELSGNRTLNNILSDLHESIIRFRGNSMRRAGRTVQTIKEHRDILNAIAGHNGKLANELMTLHIENSYKNILKTL